MEKTVFDALLYLTTSILVLYNLYGVLWGKKNDKQDQTLQSTEKVLQDFILAYSGEYTEIKHRIKSLEGQLERAEIKNDAMRADIMNLIVELKIVVSKVDMLYGQVEDHLKRS